MKIEPPLPSQGIASWSAKRQAERLFKDTLKLWGISIEGEATHELDNSLRPGTVNIKSVFKGPDELAVEFEINMPKNAVGLELSGTLGLETSATSSQMIGDLRIGFRETGISTKGSWTDRAGLRLEEGNLTWERALYEAGVTIDNLGIPTSEFAFKVGPYRVKIDPVQYYKRAKWFDEQMRKRVKESVQKKLLKVGGVHIQFDPSRIAAAISDQPPSEAQRLGRVVIVSLRRLIKSREAGRIRDLGEMTTIFGFLVDRRTKDILLIGQHEPWAPKIDVDLLLAILRSTWRDGLAPWVSIDPSDNLDPNSAHRARFGGIGKGLDRSALVKVLLDADYRMKKVMLSSKTPSIAEFKNYHALETEDASSPHPIGLAQMPQQYQYMGQQGRFWFIPRQPRVGDIWELDSPEGALYVFGTDIQITGALDLLAQSENMGFGVHTASPPGNPIIDLAVLSFNQHLPTLERHFDEFKRLRQVFELVLFAELLRLKQVQMPVIEDLSRLAVADTTPQMTFKPIGPHGLGDSGLYLSGGVNTHVRVGQSALRRVDGLSIILNRLRAIKSSTAIITVEGFFLPVLQPTSMSDTSIMVESLAREAVGDIARQDYRAALTSLSKAIALQPEASDILFQRGVVYDRLGDTENATKDYSGVLRINPRDWLALFNRGVARARTKQLRQAISDFSGVIELTPISQAYYNRGKARMLLRDFKNAEQDFSQALRIDPYHSKSYHNRAIVKEETGDFAGAIEDYSEVLKLDPHNPKANYYRGINRVKTLEFIGAIRDLNIAIERNPRLTTAYVGRCLSYEGTNQLERAIRDCTDALKLDPSNATARMALERLRKLPAVLPPAKDLKEEVLAGDMALDHRAYQSAIEHYSNAIELIQQADHPTNQDLGLKVHLHLRRALAYLPMGHHELAIPDLTKVLDLVPGLAPPPPPDVLSSIYTLRCKAHTDLDKVSAAIRDCQRAVEVDSTNQEAKELLQKLGQKP